MKDGLTKEQFMLEANKTNEKFPTFNPNEAWDHYVKEQREKIASRSGSGLMSRSEYIRSVDSINQNYPVFDPHASYDDYLEEKLGNCVVSKKESTPTPKVESLITCVNCYTKVPKETLKTVASDRYGQVDVCDKCFLQYCINHDIEKEYCEKEYKEKYGEYKKST